MSTSNQEREAQIAKKYHSTDGLPTSTGVNTGSQGDTVLIGEDDRRDYYTLDTNTPEDALKKRLTDATVILTDKDNLIEQADGTFKLKVDKFERQGLPPCSEERFAEQHIGGWCSGFMVGPDIIVTAGHCGETEVEIQNTAYLFGFHVTSPDDSGTTVFSRDQVYFGKKLLAHDLSATGDYAVVQVDREITAPDASPLEVRKNGSLSLGMNVGVIGYPSGLPVKIAFGDTTVVREDDDPWLFANLDTYGGNSGSAVFNAEGLVEGILVRGARDYDMDFVNQCFRSNQIEDDEGREAVTKASVFVEKLPDS